MVCWKNSRKKKQNSEWETFHNFEIKQGNHQNSYAKNLLELLINTVITPQMSSNKCKEKSMHAIEMT